MISLMSHNYSVFFLTSHLGSDATSLPSMCLCKPLKSVSLSPVDLPSLGGTR